MIIHQGEASHAGRMSVLKVGTTLNDMAYVCDRDSVRESLYCSAINHNNATAVVGGTRRIHVFSNFLDAQSPVTSIRLKSDVFTAAFWDRGGGCGMSDNGILAGCRDGTIQLYDLRSSLRYPSLVIPQPRPPGSVSNILSADSGSCILANYNNGSTCLYDVRMSQRKRQSGNIVREYQRGKNYIVTSKLGLNGCSRSGAVICSGVAGDVNLYRDGIMESIWSRKFRRQGTEEVCVAIENYDHEDHKGWICVGSEGSAAFVGV
ncbi:hypothetical protein BKA69DRAFT_127523 [Paraphysoderma sedebokerense]|nr:hypothetical protein BKA69DRAFT_127523 [Paraphysoderma sedebokerense]